MKTTGKMLSLGCLIFTATNIFSQNLSNNNAGNPIDIRLKACLDSSQNETTVGMVGCTYEAEQEWDTEMNKYYKLLMEILSPEEKTKLKAAQLKWLAFRDAESDASGTIYNDMQGTMWRISAADATMEIVKQRALELKSYYDDLNMH